MGAMNISCLEYSGKLKYIYMWKGVSEVYFGGKFSLYILIMFHF